jgi:hypothetical protein
MEKQTAVEWLHHLHKKGILIEKSFEMAKEMEKEQHSETFIQGVKWMQYQRDLVNGGAEYWDKEPSYFLKYYTETYSDGKKN